MDVKTYMNKVGLKEYSYFCAVDGSIDRSPCPIPGHREIGFTVHTGKYLTIHSMDKTNLRIAIDQIKKAFDRMLQAREKYESRTGIKIGDYTGKNPSGEAETLAQYLERAWKITDYRTQIDKDVIDGSTEICIAIDELVEYLNKKFSGSVINYESELIYS